MTNRIIKFRVWSKKDSKFGYIELTDGGEGKPHIRMPKPHITYGTNNVVYQQYTGLKDKNGKDIYSGDILYRPQEAGLPTQTIVNDVVVKGMTLKGDSWARTYEVVDGLPNGWLWIKSIYPHKDEGMVKHNDWTTFEVIGNIYEDSHLLSADSDKFRKGAK